MHSFIFILFRNIFHSFPKSTFQGTAGSHLNLDKLDRPRQQGSQACNKHSFVAMNVAGFWEQRWITLTFQRSPGVQIINYFQNKRAVIIYGGRRGWMIFRCKLKKSITPFLSNNIAPGLIQQTIRNFLQHHPSHN